MHTEALRWRLIHTLAQRCAASGWRKIALFGAGRHTTPIVRQPWQWENVRVVAILDDSPKAARLSGVPVMKPEHLDSPIDAIVISSDAYEHQLYHRALAVFGSTRFPILRIYGDDATARETPEATFTRLTQHWGIADADARWLVDNRDERHDATLPMLPPERTEMHLRRYELIAPHVPGRRVLDIACGTGYGSRYLLDQGEAASVLGLDVDPRAIDYATRRFTTGIEASRLGFAIGDAARLEIPSASIGAIASFETIEHVPDAPAALAEFRRVLAPGGRLCISTPNDTGPTPHHAHSFTPAGFESLLRDQFANVQMYGQIPGDVVFDDTLPPGIFRRCDNTPRPAILLAMVQA